MASDSPVRPDRRSPWSPPGSELLLTTRGSIYQGGLDHGGRLGGRGDPGLGLHPRLDHGRRTNGSVPLGRSRTRPSWPSSASALTTASHTSAL